MTIRETVSQVIAENEKAFRDMPEARAAKLVQLTLEAIARQIEETDEGKVAVQGLGMFVIKNVERDKDGAKSTVKRITLRMKGGRADETGAAAKKAARAERKGREPGERKARDPAERTAAKAARKAAKGGRKAADDE